jgi:hypothetical protein
LLISANPMLIDDEKKVSKSNSFSHDSKFCENSEKKDYYGFAVVDSCMLLLELNRSASSARPLSIVV